VLLDASSGAAVDSESVSFGVRNASFTADRGLLINGFPVKVRGFSMHQDMAGTGSFVPPNLLAYKMQRILQLGGNAYRTAHNSVDQHVLQEADRRGVLVWEENRFLRNFQQYVQDATDMVLRDRNSPSVVIWSLANENGCGEVLGHEGAPPGEASGAMLGSLFMSAIAEVDGTRPVTCNSHNTLDMNGTIMDVLPVIGLTYDYGSLSKIHAAKPSTPVLNGESASCESARGDLDSSGAMACSRDSWATADANAWVAGSFGVWSGMDYRGESSWPSVISFYGVLDYAGFAKPVADWCEWRALPVLCSALGPKGAASHARSHTRTRSRSPPLSPSLPPSLHSLPLFLLQTTAGGAWQLATLAQRPLWLPPLPGPLRLALSPPL
jgi:beta-galactosidase